MKTDTLVPKTGNWQYEMRQAIRDVGQLCEELRLGDLIADEAILVDSAFPLFVPRPFLRRMKPAKLDDPLLLQVLPLALENRGQEGFVDDPVGDLRSAVQSNGLLQKYNGRALMIATGAKPS